MYKKLIYFFVLTFLISWSLWLPFYFNQEINESFVILGGWGPTISALILTYINGDKNDVIDLLKKVLIWRVKIKYYLFSIFGIMLLFFLNLFFNQFILNVRIDYNLITKSIGLENLSFVFIILFSPILFLINTFIGGPIAEELGWRGYAQSLLQEKINYNLSGLIIGFIWAIWHLPLFIFLPKATANIPLFYYIILFCCFGVLFSWLYNKSTRSILTCILFHGGINFTIGLIGSELLSNENLLISFLAFVLILTILLSTKNKKELF